MARSSGKRARREANEPQGSLYPEISFKEVSPLNWAQETYLQAITDNTIIFGVGSAGTGKTYLAAMYAAAQLYHRKIDKIYLTRPNIETGRSLGFLPGELDEKYAPYLEPFDSAFSRAFGRSFYEYLLKNKNIEPRPLGFMRGTTFDNSIVLVDECQQMTQVEFKMLLSRIGKNTKIILSGDDDQSDIPDSGLQDAIRRLQHIKGIEVVRFVDSDIVRSAMCKQIIMAYR